jgi:hypothetical protein
LEQRGASGGGIGFGGDELRGTRSETAWLLFINSAALLQEGDCTGEFVDSLY